MGVIDGQPVSAAITNPAFLDANADDTAQGKISLDNASDVATSGVAVNNIQREFNALSSFTGKALNVAKNTTPSWSNNDVGTSGDTLKDRADYLTQKFNGSTGHGHSGLPGDGPQLLASNLGGVPLAGYWNQATDLTGASGTSTNVTTQLTGKSVSTGQTVLGVVSTSPYNRVILRQATGANTGDEILDGSGNQVYGRLTYAASTWTLSFYVDISGTETAFTLPSTDVRWYYQELFNPMVSPPVYSSLAFIPSDNTTADVLNATTTVAGKVLLSSSAPGAIASTGAQGSSTAVARQDHTHEGVHSVGAYGIAGTAPKGDVQIEAGSAITLSYNSGRIKIDGAGAVGVQEQPSGPVNNSNAIFGPLSQTPSSTQSILVFLDGVIQESSLWSLLGNSIQFVTPPKYGQSVWCFYLTTGTATPPPTPSGVLVTEYRTISAGEISAKQMTLTGTTVTAANTLVDAIGGCAQIFAVDFTVAGNILSWNGYNLDGVLAAGDVLRIQYWT